MKCLGVKDEHRLYYDYKHGEYLLMTPNFRFTYMMGHCNNSDVAEWAYDMIKKHKKAIEYLMTGNMPDGERYKKMKEKLGKEVADIKFNEFMVNK